MTHLRYFMPLVIEGNKMGLKSTFYIGPSGKYNCPFRHREVLTDLSIQHKIDLIDLRNVKNCTGVLFSSEKTGINAIKNNKNAKKVVLTYQTDFIESYSVYEPFVDHILMPSENIAKYYNLDSDKNLYLGIPKYDVTLNKSDIFTKYGIPQNKSALIVLPKGRDASLINLSKILDTLKGCGFTNLLKTRGKDKLNKQSQESICKKNDYYFEDFSWYPHTTQELMHISDIVINFGSTTVEECVMHESTLINFDIKPQFRNGSERPYRVTHNYLYNYNYCIQLDKQFTQGQFMAAIDYLLMNDHTLEFQKAKSEFLYTHKNSSKLILENIL